MGSFKSDVITKVKSVPFGKVVSYGQVALVCGKPRGARGVGWILNSLEEAHQVPWWRVVNNLGRITIKGSIYTPEDQKRELQLEGIEVSDDFEIDIEKYRYKFN